MAIMHPVVYVIERTAQAWTSKEQAATQARLIAIELIENGLVLNGQIVNGMPIKVARE